MAINSLVLVWKCSKYCKDVRPVCICTNNVSTLNRLLSKNWKCTKSCVRICEWFWFRRMKSWVDLFQLSDQVTLLRKWISCSDRHKAGFWSHFRQCECRCRPAAVRHLSMFFATEMKNDDFDPGDGCNDFPCHLLLFLQLPKRPHPILWPPYLPPFLDWSR